MPSADDLISDFDDFHETLPPPEPVEEASPPKKSKVSKKKKGRKHVKAPLEDEEDTPYAKSVTPSPPTFHGVSLDSPPAPPAADPVDEPEPEHEPELAPQLLDEAVEYEQPFAFDDESTAVEELEPLPPKPPPARSPVIRSPRPAIAKPIIPTTSPPQRPPSLYGAPQQYGGPGGYRSNSAAGQPTPVRRESFATQQRSPKPRIFHAPPPHMPQPHFFGVPDLGLGVMSKQEQGQTAGSGGYCCRFDSFADAGDAASARKAKDALLVGSERCVEVYKVSPDKMELAGRLEGLRGAVIDAKVLPHANICDPMQTMRPLLAVVVHGRFKSDDNPAAEAQEEVQAKATLYQTTVEIYSLQSQQHVATLYKSATLRGDPPVMGHLALPPKPVGDLSLDAAGRFVTLTSGKSGEIFVYAHDTFLGEDASSYRCIAKYWTALQVDLEASRPASAHEGPAGIEGEKRLRTPLISLSGRWLAIVPPYTSTSISIQGTSLASQSHSQPYGAATHVAPAQPALNCEVAGIDAEGTLSWLSRKAAQGMVRVSQRGYEMGVQGWRELTHPSPPNSQSNTSQEQVMFPPTNAPADDPKRLASEPAVISIIDLQRVADAHEQRLKQAPVPLTTFSLDEGCNYLSFSPDGLRLLTSSREGEVSSVWDLAHLAHGAIKPGSDDEAQVEHGPHVKLIHRIVRTSPSIIADSAWTRDGDWLALLTAHGTVHLHEVPLTAPSRKRKRKIPAPVADKAEPTVSLSQGLSPPSSNGIMSGLKLWTQSIGTQVNAVKAQYTTPISFAGFRETAAAARSAGQRAVAKGIREGYSAAKSGASDMWHAEDNKIRLKPAQDAMPKTGWLRWVQRQSGSSLAIACGGTVYLHSVQRVMRQKGNALVSGLKKEKPVRNFPLPRISTSRDGAKGKDCATQGPHGFWSLRAVIPEQSKETNRPMTASATTTANEVETNPPYCPFHVDQRVSIFAFDDGAVYNSQAGLQAQMTDDVIFAFRTQGHGYAENEEPWLFGEPLPASIRLNEPTYDDVALRRGSVLDTDDEGVEPLVESRFTLHSAVNEAEGQEIRVTARRSRRGARRDEDGEEGGFDDLGDDDSVM